MLKRALYISLTILLIFAGIGIADAQHPEITATLKATPESYSGKCPTTIKFEGEIKVTKITRAPLKVQYKFIRSDGAFAPIQTLDFEKDGVKKVSTTWTLGGPGLPTYAGWQAIKIVYPQDVESNKANFKIECTAEAKPTDLTIKITNCPISAKAGQELGATFQVTATNHGDTPVKDVAVDIVLRKDTSCPVPAPYAIYSPNFSNGVLLKGGREHVSLNPGQTLSVKLNGTNTIPTDTPAGNYYLCAVIDAGNKVKEDDEKNNCACCPIKITGAEVIGEPIREDCVSFNPATTEVKTIGGSWKIVDGTHWMFDFGGKKDEAEKALKIIKHYRMNQSCFVGRPDPSFSYLLVSGSAPVGAFSGEDCVSFNPASTEVKNIGGRWKIVDGTHWMFDFGGKESEARQSLSIIKKYGFTNSCFVGRPAPSFKYLRK